MVKTSNPNRLKKKLFVTTIKKIRININRRLLGEKRIFNNNGDIK